MHHFNKIMKSTHKPGALFDARQLHAFVTLVEAGSYTETARRLSLTQSAVSHSMRALEVETGCRLLAKVGNSVMPSEAGEALLHHARIALKEFVKARAALDQLKTWGVRRLRIGASSFLNQRLVPGVLTSLRRQYPRLVVTVKTAVTARDIESLRTGELDWILGEEPPANNDLDFTPFFQSSLRVIVPAAHRWLPRQPVPATELTREPFLLPERPSSLRSLIERYYLREDKSLNCVAEVDSLETIKELIQAGFGVGILPAWIVKDEIATGALRALPPGRPELHQTWGLLRWRMRPMDAIEVAFSRSCAKAAKKFATAA